MEVTRYTFESPYPNQIQIGKKDPSVKQEEESQKQSAQLTQNTNESLQKAKEFETSQTQEVKATVTSENSLDVYA